MRAPHVNSRIRIIEFHNCETFRLDNVTTSTMLICNQKSTRTRLRALSAIHYR